MNAQDLKNSILQLAIQGRLVEQRPEEGTAKELLEQIKAEKEQFIRDKKIKKEKPLPEITEEEIPFEIPESWEWVRIGSICSVVNGFTPSKSNPKFWDNGTIPWFTIADVRSQGRFINQTEQYITEHAISKNTERIIPKDSILLCCTASVGEYAYTNIPLTTNQQFNGLVIKDEYKKIVYPMYIYEFAKTLERTLLSQAGKTTINFVSVMKVSNIIIPLPPLEEQKRIVAKIEELMPYIEQYSEAHSKLEAFNKKFPEDMQKSILQYAIQGKLVEQREDGGTAEELYQQIQNEKARLIKEGKIKKEKQLAEITEDEIPFEIPESWKWVRLRELAVLENGDRSNKYPKESDYTDVGIPFFGAKDMGDDSMMFDNVRFISEKKFNELGNGKLQDKDVICLLRGSVGKMSIFKANEQYSTGFICAQMLILRFMQQEILRYVGFVMKSPMFRNILETKITGTAVKQLPAEELGKIVIPFPPLAEQKRIVTKIEEIMPYCRQLIK